jgi:hypothetical protein
VWWFSPEGYPGFVEKLLRAAHLAINPGFVWWFSPEGYPGFVE